MVTRQKTRSALEFSKLYSKHSQESVKTGKPPRQILFLPRRRSFSDLSQASQLSTWLWGNSRLAWGWMAEGYRQDFTVNFSGLTAVFLNLFLRRWQVYKGAQQRTRRPCPALPGRE